MKVAFVGIGKMGLPMAGNVLRAGHELTVFNRTASRCDPLRDDGATVATSAAEAVRGAEVLVTMVADGPRSSDQLEGDEGFLADAPDGLVWLEMSTIGPTAARRFAARAADAGVEMLDAPVSGAIAVAEAAGAGVDGRRLRGDALERARPVLEAMTKAHFHLGASGAGAAMKLGVNVMIAAADGGDLRGPGAGRGGRDRARRRLRGDRRRRRRLALRRLQDATPSSTRTARRRPSRST